ncbi:SAM-dependent methyltransferase [Saccharomonospora iraqiensis]|uniref:SAM-dependent methyltransferase n=1 Tax=Saccharomonospora iraqiensis TaxID=52698 RepID=UPI00022E2B96|nr:SAM-dependent methyltransferase [Saccharomonospora iraqiensis]
MRDERPPSAELDTTRPSIARVYDAFLGGKDNYAVDRAVYEQVKKVVPHQAEVGWMNRAFLVRVVRYLADVVGVDQFLDLGSGLPTVQNTHQVAQQNNPRARVVYVDNDPVCNAHGRALLEENDRTHFVEADLTEPKALLAHPGVTAPLDLTRPVALMQIGTLHHVSDEQDPAAIMREYVDALPSGSYVTLTHFWDPGDEDPELHRRAVELERTVWETGMGTGWWRGRDAIGALFGGLEPLPPGLVELHEWWPDGPATREPWPEEHLMLGGLAHKP